MTENSLEAKAHWDQVYDAKNPDQLSWFQRQATFSLRLIHAAGATPQSRIIDVGGGASCLPREMLDVGFEDITVLDISAKSLAKAKQALGTRADRIAWIEGDVTHDAIEGRFDIWHDRAVLHFLTDPDDRARYRNALLDALAENGQAIIATFAMDGPERCSGLPVVRYDAPLLSETLGPGLKMIETVSEQHVTPGGALQRFAWFRLRRREALEVGP